MSNFLLNHVGAYPWTWASSTSSSGGADPQLQFFENIPGKYFNGLSAVSLNTLSIHAVNIPLSLSFNYPVVLVARGANNATRSGSATFQFGLYSSTNSVIILLSTAGFSLENSASGTLTWGGANTSTVWQSLVTSATENITPGAWYFALNISTATNNAGAANFSVGAFHSSNNPGNAQPVVLSGRMTVSTGAMPAFIATSDLDITGGDALRQPYIIITA